MLYPEPDKRGRGNKGKAEETSDFSQKRLAQARAILASPELAAAVRDLNGSSIMSINCSPSRRSVEDALLRSLFLPHLVDDHVVFS
jgi:hypothetical protein